MADPAVAGTAPRGALTPPPLRPPGLLERALTLALDHAATPRDTADRWRFGPLVIVSPAEDAASAAVVAAAETRALPLVIGTVAMHSGRDVDREIAAATAGDRLDGLTEAFSACRLVVVDRVDRIAAGDRREAFGHMLDHSAARGTVWVVSTPVHPARGGGTRVDSRLCGGLVVPPVESPARDPGWRAAPGAAPSMARIIRAAARLHDIESAVVIGPSRRRTVAAARSLAMYLARRLTGRSLQAIGAACGGRDHSTVIHGVRVCAARIARDPAFSAEVARVAAALGAAGADTGDHVEARRPRVGSATLVSGRSGRRRLA